MPDTLVAGFLTHLVADIDELPYTLEQPLVYASAVLGGILTVPKGFPTDLYSIPPIARSVVPTDGKANGAAVLHDFLFQTGAFAGRALTRETCNAVINEAMICGGMPTWRRLAIMAGLKVGSWYTWNRYRRENTHAD